MAFDLDCNGDLQDVEVSVGGGVATFGSGARVQEVQVTSSDAIVLAGDDFSVYNGLEIGGSNSGGTQLLVSGSNQRIKNLHIDPNGSTGIALEVTGDENTIDAKIEGAKDNQVDVSGDDNNIEFDAQATIQGGNTPDGVNISGDRNRVVGLLTQGGVAITNGVVLTAASADNFTCIHQTGTITNPYTDSGTTNSRCVTSLDIAGAEMYVSTPAATTIGTAGTFVKASGTTTLSAGALDFTMPSNNRLTYGGKITKRFWIMVAMSLTTGTAVQNLSIRIAKNGTTVAATEIDRLTGGASDIGAAAMTHITSLDETDYLEIFLTNKTATNSVTWELGNMVVAGLA